ncbi:hypothetical protein DL96DRAFT_1817312 [Flagelloscypha sp. PMI_526]|nr:hypothetical protein DL96DRAFT_1817312 [Flagelloscypha sp. PMI_526]
MSLPGSPLPIELEREIFLFCAASDLKAISSLSLVSRLVREWTEPFRFRHIVLSRTYSFIERTLSLLESKSSAFRSNVVKSLVVDLETLGGVEEVVAIDKILDICPGLTDLSLWSYFPDDVFLRKLPTLPNLIHISVNWRTIYPFSDFCKLERISSITHIVWELDMIGHLEGILPNLPNLSHFRLVWLLEADEKSETITPWMSSLSRIAERNTTQVVLARLVEFNGRVDLAGWVARYPSLQHPKVVATLSLQPNGSTIAEGWGHWSLETLDGCDPWWKAEKVIKRRRRKRRIILAECRARSELNVGNPVLAISTASLSTCKYSSISPHPRPTLRDIFRFSRTTQKFLQGP